MQEKYNHLDVEASAQLGWNNRDAYRVTEDASREKFYACSMLPYPSGKLHMGHVRNYTINDMLTRHLRMKGFNVLMPMGWDAFGLPAENAALKNGVPPAKWTMDNIADMKQQLQALGLAIDWSREIATCDPSYYKWNQWLFLKMLDKGIAYRKTQVVNWDPVDQTVLANEQVIDGKGWRTGAPVEKREIPGYYLKITDYAQELLGQVQEHLPGWPERVKLMQENWIGKSEGVRLAFTHEIKNDDGTLIGGGRMYVFTTRADTVMGVTFCAVAAEHPLATHAAHNNPALAAFIEECKRGGTTEAEVAVREKEGMRTGLFVTHPLSGHQVEVWVGNYVLMGYGDGAVMGVPAHDERDFIFAKKYDIPIVEVILIDGYDYDYDKWNDWYGDKQRGVTINSDSFSGLRYQEAVNAIAHALQIRGPGREDDHLAAARLGCEPPALLGHAHTHHPLRRTRCSAGARKRPAGGIATGLHSRRLRQPAGTPRRFSRWCQLPGVRQTGAARNRHHGHVCRQFVVLHAVLRPEQQRCHGRRRRKLLDADGPVHRRGRARRAASAVRPVLDQGHARPGPAHHRRALHQAADPGHGAEPDLLPVG